MECANWGDGLPGRRSCNPSRVRLSQARTAAIVASGDTAGGAVDSANPVDLATSVAELTE
jgi:hypothetical protein